MDFLSIPFQDLTIIHRQLEAEIDNAIKDVLTSGMFLYHPVIGQFQEAFAAYQGCNYCIGCANGTDALEVLIAAMGILPGDEVIVPALSWISTASAVTRAGAKVVFADVDSNYLTLDPEDVARKITKKTKMIIPVHLYGQLADMPEIMKIAHKHDLLVLEDAAQAHGAMLNGKKAGQFGHAAAFSFFPTKVLGAFGDAGAMLTNDIYLAKKARNIAAQGRTSSGNHLVAGQNSRMDALQAAILMAKLPYLPQWIGQRQQIAAWYQQKLNALGLSLVPPREGASHVWYVAPTTHHSRDDLQAYLAEKNIKTHVHYPIPLPLMKAYDYYRHQPGDFPVATKACRQLLSLPIFIGLEEEQVCRITDAITAFSQG